MAAIRTCFVLCLLAGLISSTYQYGDDSRSGAGDFANTFADGLDGIRKAVSGGFVPGGNTRTVYVKSEDGKSHGFSYSGTYDNGQGGYGGGGGYSSSGSGSGGGFGWDRYGDNSRSGAGNFPSAIADGLDGIRKAVSGGFGPGGNTRTVYVESEDGKSGGFSYSGTYENGQGGYGGGGGYSSSGSGGGFGWGTSSGHGGGVSVKSAAGMNSSVGFVLLALAVVVGCVI